MSELSQSVYSAKGIHLLRCSCFIYKSAWKQHFRVFGYI